MIEKHVEFDFVFDENCDKCGINKMKLSKGINNEEYEIIKNRIANNKGIDNEYIKNMELNKKYRESYGKYEEYLSELDKYIKATEEIKKKIQIIEKEIENCDTKNENSEINSTRICNCIELLIKYLHYYDGYKRYILHVNSLIDNKVNNHIIHYSGIEERIRMGKLCVKNREIMNTKIIGDIKKIKEYMENNRKIVEEIRENIIIKYLSLSGKNGAEGDNNVSRIVDNILRKIVIPNFLCEMKTLINNAKISKLDTLSIKFDDKGIEILNSGQPLHINGSYVNHIVGVIIRVILAKINRTSRFDFLLLDEILDKNHNTQKESTISLIEYISKNYEWIAMISHDTMLQNSQNTIINVHRVTNKKKVKSTFTIKKCYERL